MARAREGTEARKASEGEAMGELTKGREEEREELVCCFFELGELGLSLIGESAKRESSIAKLSGAGSYVRGARGEALGLCSESAKEGGGLLFELGSVRAEELGGSLLFES